jgi:DNA repair exonuclease SbcCD ATPase subunit
MFKFLKKKEKNEEETQEENAEEESSEKPEKTPPPSNNDVPSLIKISTDVERLKASVEAFAEIRKSFTERFTRTSEQIGELRSMILERDRTIQTLELKAVKAADLVESIKPDKFMVELEKQNVKIEALKANLEGNEAIVDRVMEELKEIRRKIDFFRGVEEIINLSEEVKKELIAIKKIEGTINIQTDKVQTIYSEMRKKMQNLDTFNSQLQETRVNIDQSAKDIDTIRTKLPNFAEKSEVDKILDQIKKYTDSLKEIQKKTPLTRDIERLKGLLDGLD